MKKVYKVHFEEQTVYVEASEEAEAEFNSRMEVECDAIDESTREEAIKNGAIGFAV